MARIDLRTGWDHHRPVCSRHFDDVFHTGQGEAASSETGLQMLVIWGVALLLFSFMSGRIHDIAIGLHRSVKHLQDEIKSFVAIDRVTGFDNKQRMKLELSEEIKRAERYGNSFVFTASYALFQRVQIPVRRKRNRSSLSICQQSNQIMCPGNR